MSEQEETRPEKTTVWFVRDGHMHSGWIIGHVDINVEVAKSDATHTKAIQVLQQVMTKPVDNIQQLSEAATAVKQNARLDDFVSRPGRWFYLSGMSVVHADDCHSTRKAAAEAYTKFLMGEE